MIAVVVLCSLATLSLSGQLHAQPAKGASELEFSGSFSRYDLGSDLGDFESTYGRVGYGYYMTSSVQFRVAVMVLGGSDDTEVVPSLGFTVLFGKGTSSAWYLRAAVTQWAGDDIGPEAFLGLRTYLGEKIALSYEVGHLVIGDLEGVQANVGFSVFFN